MPNLNEEAAAQAREVLQDSHDKNDIINIDVGVHSKAPLPSSERVSDSLRQGDTGGAKRYAQAWLSDSFHAPKSPSRCPSSSDAWW